MLDDFRLSTHHYIFEFTIKRRLLSFLSIYLGGGISINRHTEMEGILTSNFMANTGIELDFPLKKNFDLIVAFEAGKYFDDAIISDFINLKRMVYTIEIGGRIILDFKK